MSMDPRNVGIMAMELYLPRSFVDQGDLEIFDGVSPGKYTAGLGQAEMAFCGDDEDINSICLTVTAMLLEQNQIDPHSIGFLCVGTETLVDKSKSVKSHLMQLFPGNGDIQGVDVKNACFGGTQALFHAVDWVYANWKYEGRYAIVVMGDIAVYAPGSARCAGGAGAIAMLIGPEAALSLVSGTRAVYMMDTWDFYKPNGDSEYPVFDGPASLRSYFWALDECYRTYKVKSQKKTGNMPDLNRYDSVMFHAPFCRHVQKALGRLAFHDFVSQGTIGTPTEGSDQLKIVSSMDSEQTYTDRAFLDATLNASRKQWLQKTQPNLLFNYRSGNMYTPSLFAQLFGLLHRSMDLEQLDDHRILLYSYGSGCAAAMFSLEIRTHGSHAEQMNGYDGQMNGMVNGCSDSGDAAITKKSTVFEPQVKQLTAMKRSADAAAGRLEQRIRVSADRYAEIMDQRERCNGKGEF